MTKIDCTPTWIGLLPAMLQVLESGSSEGKQIVKEELRNMAKAADLYNEMVNKENKNKAKTS